MTVELDSAAGTSRGHIDRRKAQFGDTRIFNVLL
jgi:hypothetical protein